MSRSTLEEMTLDDAHFGLFKGHVFDSSIAKGIANGSFFPDASSSSRGAPPDG